MGWDSRLIYPPNADRRVTVRGHQQAGALHSPWARPRLHLLNPHIRRLLTCS
jgi:hypothetical protein